ncbi:MAG: hypothetical protein IJY74_03670 [Oscillospiraceae bacterium]|nr:hypothetical protein [Oscillospiraceae bacterium]
MKKSAYLLSLSCALAVLISMPISVSASQSDPYDLSVQLSDYALTAEEAASGEAVIHVAAHLKGSTKLTMGPSSIQCGLITNTTDNVYFRNVVNPSEQSGDPVTYEYSGGSFTTAYTPFCFGGFNNNGDYVDRSMSCIVRDVCMDPVNGSTIYYAGNDTITFALPGRFYVNEAGELAQDNVIHNIVCPLTINEDGSATYTYKFASIFTERVDGELVYFAEVDTAVGTIPYYQPELLKEGDMIPDTNARLSWIASSDIERFLGNSDEFPLFETDACFKADSGCGIYPIALEENYCNINLTDDATFKSETLKLQYQNAAVAVGVHNAVLNQIEAPEYALDFADDAKMITAPSMGASITCDMEYVDGLSETIEVTGAVNAGATPNALWKEAGSTYYNGEVPMLCGDSTINAGGTVLTQAVLIGLKGDANLSGSVGIDDATAVLTYYAQNAAGMTAAFTDDPTSGDEILAYFLADIDTESKTMTEGGVVDIADATSILTYYASTAAGINISWDEFI